MAFAVLTAETYISGVTPRESRKLARQPTDSPLPVVLTLALRIRALRHKKGWSQERLAEEATMHRTYLAGIERGLRNPSLRNLTKLARALGVTNGITPNQDDRVGHDCGNPNLHLRLQLQRDWCHVFVRLARPGSERLRERRGRGRIC